jgi:phage terminase large subunit-like protein
MTLLIEKPRSTLSFAARANRYARDVLSGKVNTCLYVRQACQRHLDNLEASKRADYPYRFDKEAADLICSFAENMVHVKGKWAGQRLNLEPWQIFLFSVGWGWLQKADGMRRFREIYWAIPRKNGKSLMGAVAGNYMGFAEGEPGAEVYSGATSEKQAWKVFWQARMMVVKNEEFKDQFGIFVGAKNLCSLLDGSKFEPIIGDPGDGDSAHCAIVDEYHEHKTSGLYDTMKTGMGARSQPMRMVITTAGSDSSSPCFEKHNDAIKILAGDIKNEETFVIIYAIDKEDDWTDFENWKKANPNIGVSISEDFLRARLAEALVRASEQNVLKTKHLNIWTSVKIAWINIVLWDKNDEPGLSLERFRGQNCWVSLDLASKIDLVALMLLFREPIDEQTIEMPYEPESKEDESESMPQTVMKKINHRYFLFGRYYLAEETVKLPQNAHYQAWAAAGKLIATPGARTDFWYVLEDLRKFNKMFSIKELSFDPSEANMLVQLIQNEMSFPCIEINQAPAQISEPMKEFEALYMSENLRHVPADEDPVLRWSAGNVVLANSKTKKIYPAKEIVANKIDPIVAAIMGLKRAMVAVEPKKSIYETRGVVFLTSDQ